MPLLAFFLLAYVLSWASFYALGGPALFTLGPLLAAVIVSAATAGPGGVRQLFGRMVRWRVPPAAYLAAMLVPIGIGGLAAVLASRLNTTPARLPLAPWYSAIVLFAMLVLTGDTFSEETGWRAFALPRFSARRSPLANALILGVLLAGWHLPVALSEPGALVPYLLATVASAVVTNWVYYRAHESGLLAWLYHTVANTAGQYVIPLFPAPERATYFWALAGANVIAAAALALATGPNLGRRAS